MAHVCKAESAKLLTLDKGERRLAGMGGWAQKEVSSQLEWEWSCVVLLIGEGGCFNGAHLLQIVAATFPLQDLRETV